MKKQILGAACAFSLTVVGGYASAQTTTTDIPESELHSGRG